MLHRLSCLRWCSVCFRVAQVAFCRRWSAMLPQGRTDKRTSITRQHCRYVLLPSTSRSLLICLISVLSRLVFIRAFDLQRVPQTYLPALGNHGSEVRCLEPWIQLEVLFVVAKPRLSSVLRTVPIDSRCGRVPNVLHFFLLVHSTATSSHDFSIASTHSSG